MCHRASCKCLHTHFATCATSAPISPHDLLLALVVTNKRVGTCCRAGRDLSLLLVLLHPSERAANIVMVVEVRTREL